MRAQKRREAREREMAEYKFTDPMGNIRLRGVGNALIARYLHYKYIKALREDFLVPIIGSPVALPGSFQTIKYILE